ncbi:MAG: 2Fe-2S iron-sulfur cluster binding domain-containing protein [Nitrospirae bacterium]|nr:MAG: 2Fe-2S iron-sulfur cluster binding domain-containing protein [Nitrospirota bacterium]
MANKLNVTIDGIKVQAPEGSNLIDAASLAGVHIPNLCYLKGLKGIGACRLCMVEIEGLKAPMIACTTKVKEGMKVNTKSERLIEMRKFVIDLILSMHPLDCMTCTKAGVCNLQQYAYDFEIKESSFTRKKFGFAVDEGNPFIKRDPDYCVLCGRCVRVCKNQGTNVLEFMGRGVGSKVTTANDKPLQDSGCTFCGSCIDVCPVNAILEADRWKKGREWDYEKTASVCLLCGNACDITVCTKDGMVMKINSGGEEGAAEKYICAYGRYGFDSVSSDIRVSVPMKRVDGKLQETTWEDALGIVAAELGKAGGKAGFVTNAALLNEDALALKKLAADSVGTKNIDSTLGLYGGEEVFACGSADLEHADAIVLVDMEPCQWKRSLPALDAVIRRRVNSGAKLVVVNSKETALSSVAAVTMTGDESASLMSVAKALIDKGVKADKKISDAVGQASVSEEAAKAAEIIAGAANPVIISSPALFDSAANIGAMKGSAIAAAPESNAKGIALVGLNGGGKSYKEMLEAELDLLYVVGDITVDKRPDAKFLIVQTPYMGGLAKDADIVLPAASWLEADGSIVDGSGRLRTVSAAIEKSADAKAHKDIFIGISKALGKPVKDATAAEVKKLAKTKTKAASGNFSRNTAAEFAAQDVMRKINVSVVEGSRLLWLKESEKAAV